MARELEDAILQMRTNELEIGTWLINRQGMATGVPMVRDTSQPEFRIASGLRYQDIKVNHSLERLLLLTKSSATDRAY